MNNTKKSISDLVLEYFKKHPRIELKHGPVVDWVTKEYLKYHYEPPRDPWRAIRKLHQEGKLIKVNKGIYKYDPDYINNVELWEFSEKTKKEILKKDNYKCVVCGRGVKDGVELVVDHIKSKDKGGTNTIENGETLCMEHNLMKKNYSQTEAGKNYFIKMYNKAVKINDPRMIKFCKCVFNCYDAYKINGHIKRPNNK
ncbi:MAG: HNH endonuclease [Candidatus Cloacimonadota bacterium]|nr:HNH endonuclease [Candidatus Cloacimonadota bacterium]